LNKIIVEGCIECNNVKPERNEFFFRARGKKKPYRTDVQRPKKSYIIIQGLPENHRHNSKKNVLAQFYCRKENLHHMRR
jgi:hypothetical protein